MKKFLVILVCFFVSLFLSTDKSVFRKNSSNDVFRVDIAGVNDVRSINVSANDAMATQYPAWCKDCSVGIGNFDQIKRGEAITWSVDTVKSDRITIILRGPDVKHGDKRVPVYVVYKNLVVNGNLVLDGSVVVSHDKPYKHTIDMKARQKVELSVVPEKASVSTYWKTLRIKWHMLVLYFGGLMVLYAIFLKFSKKKVK